MLDTGYKILDTGYWILDVSSSPLGVGGEAGAGY